MKKSVPNLPKSSMLTAPAKNAKVKPAVVAKTAKMGKATANVGKGSASAKVMAIAKKGKAVKAKKGY
jgi:hypothetical protein